MALLGALASSAAVALVVVVTAYTIARLRSSRYDVIDVAWGVLFIAIAWTNIILYAPHNPLAVILAVMVSAWGLRLSRHILVRWLRSPQEDRRYIELRSRWPQRLVGVQVFLRIYIVQALLAVLVSLPVIAFMQADPVVTVFVILGAGIWLIGMICEIVADQQLARFLSDPRHRGKLMTSGIWRYSRHPNYFGEMMIWWGIAIIGLGYPLSAVGIIGALIITLILAFVSGIPLAEKGASTKPGWKAYKAQTSVLIPLPPK